MQQFQAVLIAVIYFSFIELLVNGCMCAMSYLLPTKKKEKKKNTVVKISDQFELHANVCFEIDFYKTKVEGANETKVLSQIKI